MQTRDGAVSGWRGSRIWLVLDHFHPIRLKSPKNGQRIGWNGCWCWLTDQNDSDAINSQQRTAPSLTHTHSYIHNRDGHSHSSTCKCSSLISTTTKYVLIAFYIFIFSFLNLHQIRRAKYELIKFFRYKDDLFRQNWSNGSEATGWTARMFSTCCTNGWTIDLNSHTIYTATLLCARTRWLWINHRASQLGAIINWFYELLSSHWVIL